MDEPAPLLSSVSTKYLTPLLAPGVMLNSSSNSKLPNFSLVTMSPPFLDSPPPDSNTESTPSLIFQPAAGKSLNFAPFHALEVLPSHNRRQPFRASFGVNSFFK